MKKILHKFKYGKHFITLEIGNIALNNTVSILANMENTTVLSTVVLKYLKYKVNFLPLSVHYQERSYAGGIIPGGFFRREGRPSEEELLMSRLIDRSIRPLFLPPFLYDIQIFVTLLSLNPIISPDIISIISVSSALNIVLSNFFFLGTLGYCRIGLFKHFFLLNPDNFPNKIKTIELMIAATTKNILMMECQSNNIKEDYLLKAIKFGHFCQKSVIRDIDKLKYKFFYRRFNVLNIYNNVSNDNYSIVYKFIHNILKYDLIKAYKIKKKIIRNIFIKKIKYEILFFLNFFYKNNIDDIIDEAYDTIEKNILITHIFNSNIRLDGRKNNEIRKLRLQTNILPRIHGSALFSRGETQALVTVTLGTNKDAQNIDDVLGERADNFILHYNFPPYAVDEIGKNISTKRREIGHGKLAKKGLLAIIPNYNKFPYTIRIVSEITSSNGSSSMATACGASLALMDAGVPIHNAVSGIAMGLLINKKNKQYIILSDIKGEEDNIGEIDLKIIGSTQGINCLQLDVKNIDILNFQIIKKLFDISKINRIKIINQMNKKIFFPKKNLSILCPKIKILNINPDQIKSVIGKGGIIIRNITLNTGAFIEIKDNGLIHVSGLNNEQINNAIIQIRALIEDIYVGKIYTGTVVKLVQYGAFINIHSNKEGLLHISNIIKRYKNIHEILKIGDLVIVKVLDINSEGQIRLSMKDIKRISYK